MPLAAGLTIVSLGPGYPELVFPPSFPFQKGFAISDAVLYFVLEFDVCTYYTSIQRADVRINGVSIGKIPPHPWPDLHAASFMYDAGLFGPIPPGGLGHSGPQQLEIVPPLNGSDWLMVQNWRFHYYKVLP